MVAGTRKFVAGLMVGALAAAGMLVVAPGAPAGAQPPPCPTTVDTVVEGWTCELFIRHLERGPSAEDVAGLSSLVATKGQRFAASALLFSQESAETFVYDVYDNLFERAPDDGGLAFWTARIRHDKSELGFELRILSSPEYFATFEDVQQYVGDLYPYFYGRLADEDGVNYWSDQLLSGAKTPPQVVRQFQHSVEAGNYLAAHGFAFAMDREPDVGGLAYWSKVAARSGQLNLFVKMASTPESLATLGQAGINANPCNTPPPGAGPRC